MVFDDLRYHEVLKKLFVAPMEELEQWQDEFDKLIIENQRH
jgi:hypothetical protein